MKNTDRIHRILDGDPGAARDDSSPDLDAYCAVLDLLEDSRQPAPPELLDLVMRQLPPQPKARSRWAPRWEWPGALRLPWLVPLAGALAALLLYVGVGDLRRLPGREAVAVRFELHAPAAEKVELVGTFNNWRPGDILLLGPDASGHWTATVQIPAGRHEYVFLVDGSEWLADPNAPAHRPDGFGRENALLEL